MDILQMKDLIELLKEGNIIAVRLPAGVLTMKVGEQS